MQVLAEQYHHRLKLDSPGSPAENAASCPSDPSFIPAEFPEYYGKNCNLCYVAAELSLDLILITKSWCNNYVTNAYRYLKVSGYELRPELRKDREDERTAMEEACWPTLEMGWLFIN